MLGSPQPSNSRRPVLPRDEAGSITLTEGTGGILAVCPGSGCLELYKEDVTFRLETPEDVDPERTNPHTPFVASVAERIGCSDVIIARVLLQGKAILDAATFKKDVDKAAVVRVLHSVKEALVACRKPAIRVAKNVDAVAKELRERGIARDQRGRSVPSLPQVPDLEHDATQFLISAKRAIKGVCDLVPLFVDVDRPDSNFDHLGERLARILGDDSSIVKFVQDNASSVRYLIELRNAQEHPKPMRSTRIDNFRIQPDGSVREPCWYLSGEPPAPIASDMTAGIALLVELTEWLFILLAESALDPRLPYIFVEDDQADVNPKLPIRLRLTLDVSRMKMTNVRPDADPPSTQAV